MNTIDKLKSLAGSSPYFADVANFIEREFSGNDKANEKLTNNTTLLNATQRDSSVKLRDAVTGVIVQDMAGVIARQGVLSQTVSELIGLENRINLATLNVAQDAVMATLSKTNKYEVANLKGDLNVEMATIDGLIDLDIAGVIAKSKSDIATQIGDAEHDGKVDVEKQTSLNNIALANIEKTNAIKIGGIRGDNIVKMAIIDAGIIDKESEIDVASVKSASDITVTGIKKERKYDADLIRTQADNEKKLKDLATVNETSNISLLSISDVGFIKTTSESEKGAIELSSATEALSISELSKAETKSINAMASAESISIGALSAAEISAIQANAITDSTFITDKATQDALSITNAADAKKLNLLAEASTQVEFLSNRGINQREAIDSDFSLADTLAKSLSDLETKNINALATTEVAQIGLTSENKIDTLGKEHDGQIQYIKDIAGIENKGITDSADKYYEYATKAADLDYNNKRDFFNDVEKLNKEAISKIILDGDDAYNLSRISKQTSIDSVETSEISQMGKNDAAHVTRLIGIETASIAALSSSAIAEIENNATQRDGFIRSQSKSRRENDTNLSTNVTIPSIKALSTIKVNHYKSLYDVEKIKSDSLTPAMLKLITDEQAAKVKSIGSEANARYKAATGLADSASSTAITAANESSNLKTQYDTFMKQLSSEASTKKQNLAKDIANYARETKHSSINYSAKQMNEYNAVILNDYNESGSMFEPESSLITPPIFNATITTDFK